MAVIRLQGNIADITGKPVERGTNLTVKAARATPGVAGLTVTEPENVPIGADGSITVSAVEGVKGWLYIEHDGWSDSVPFISAAGMTKLWEAVANALGVVGLSEYLKVIEEGTAGVREMAEAAVRAATLPTYIASGTDWNTLIKHGQYVRVNAGPGGDNSPNRSLGVLYVDNPGHASDALSQTFFSSSGNGVWNRGRIADGSWTEWTRLDSDLYTQEMQREIPNGTDWDTLVGNGYYFRRSTSRDDLNSPTHNIGVLFVANGGHPSDACAQTFFASSGQGLWFRSRSAVGAWDDWRRIDTGGSGGSVATGESGSSAVARREFLVGALRDRKGGTIGTGGKAAVCFRFDHWVKQFYEIGLPLLKKYNMPWAQALNSRTDNGHASGTMNWPEMQTACISTGGEVFNHAATHRDAQTDDALYDEVVNGREEIRQKLPLLTIDGWMQPGTGGSFGGLQPYRKEDDWTTVAGSLITSNHAVAYGYRGSMMKLDGNPSVGQGHLSMDKLVASQVIATIDVAVKTRSGVVLMMHPNALDGSLDNSKMTAAEFEKVLQHVAKLRAEGKLEVLSASGIQIADAGTSVRRPLIESRISGAVDSSRKLGWTEMLADGPHEVHAVVKGAGTVTVVVSSDSGGLNQTWTQQVDGWQELWLPFTIPTGVETVRLKVSGATDGRVCVRAL